jgi:UDP-N-acetylmuramyl pentapeptide phosphotransferase/UDP-N-acetylglucosamine-1-phosphate transferase
MGDVGSAFLGFTFAVLPVVAAQHNLRLALAGVLLVCSCVFAAAFTFFRRLRHRENVFAAHRSHLCCANGWSLQDIAIARSRGCTAGWPPRARSWPCSGCAG